MSDDPQVREIKMSQAQYDAVSAALEAGWKFSTSIEEVRARYGDLDFAEQVPRVMMYADIGFLIGRVELLTRTLFELERDADK